MPTVKAQIVAKGTKFTKAFVVDPLCCPSRATILTGQYSHTHGVYTNALPRRRVPRFNDSSTIATWLQADGYRTALIGKYMNEYFAAQTVATSRPAGATGSRDFDDGGTDYGLPGERRRRGSATDGRSQYYSPTCWRPRPSTSSAPRRRSSRCSCTSARRRRTSRPYRRSRHRAPVSNLAPLRPPSFNEDDVSDKPPTSAEAEAHGRPRSPPSTAPARRAADAPRRRRGGRLDPERAVGQRPAGHTLIVFASDNGYLLGEHRMNGKVDAYEESIRIPLVIRYDALGHRPSDLREDRGERGPRADVRGGRPGWRRRAPRGWTCCRCSPGIRALAGRAADRARARAHVLRGADLGLALRAVPQRRRGDAASLATDRYEAPEPGAEPLVRREARRDALPGAPALHPVPPTFAFTH